MTIPAISIRDVTMDYPTPDGVNHVLDHVSYDVAEGHFVSIVGPSGVGKTTLLRLLTGLASPTGGEIHVRGERLSSSPEGLAVVLQDYTRSLMPWLTVAKNISLPLRRAKMSRSAVQERVQESLAEVGLTGTERSYPWQLSGGMQQRASICRALIHEPRMLLLDEPFGALDAFTREELWNVLRDLWTEQRFNVILVTHDLREAAYLADTVYVMSKRPGRILARREIDLPRPRDLDITYTDRFTALVHELRSRIGEIRKS